MVIRAGALAIGALAYFGRKYDDLAAYTDSKLAITLFSLELQRRLFVEGRAVAGTLARHGTTSVAFDPMRP